MPPLEAGEIRRIADAIWDVAKKVDGIDRGVEEVLMRCSDDLHALASRRSRRQQDD